MHFAYGLNDTFYGREQIRSGAGTDEAIIPLEAYHSVLQILASSGTGTVSFHCLYKWQRCQNTNNIYGAISDIKLKENIVDAKLPVG
jgi:hypothetical protein